MSKVIRLSDEALSELNIFTDLYLKDMEKYSDCSPLALSLLHEHLDYNVSDQVAFAIRYACNNLRLYLDYQNKDS